MGIHRKYVSFIHIVLLKNVKKVKNFQLWVYREMKVLFLLDTLKFVSNDSKTHYYSIKKEDILDIQ